MNRPRCNPTRLGDCRFGLPHDMVRLNESPQQIWERCRICSRTFRWNKGYRGKTDNPAYLRAHLREFAQEGGATRRAFAKLYRPERAIIRI